MELFVLHYLKLLVVLAIVLVSGCAASSGLNSDSNPADPWESLNRKVYGLNKAIDKVIAKPITTGYKAITPDFVETGVTNIFQNLEDVPNSVNNLLQGKPTDSISDLARFIVNSTLGIVGLWDPASSMGLDKHDEDFGQTLAVWGVSSGPYVMLPILGPYTLRGTIGVVVDPEFGVLNEIDNVRTRNQIRLLKLIDRRAAFIALEEQLKSATDEYAFVREVYLQNRQFKIYDGDIPFDDDFECEEEDEEDCDF